MAFVSMEISVCTKSSITIITFEIATNFMNNTHVLKESGVSMKNFTAYDTFEISYILMYFIDVPTKSRFERKYFSTLLAKMRFHAFMYGFFMSI